MTPYSVLFVCMGNICRSPTAHGVFRHKVKANGLDRWVNVDSAGTHNYHPDSPPDERSQAHGNYSASLDGMDLDGQLIVEIKCPYKGQASALWNDVLVGHLPDHYAAQVQHQRMVSGAALAHLWVYDGSQGLLHAIERDEAAMQRIRDGWEQFQRYLDSDTPPPLTDADTVQRSDAAWTTAAQAFADAKRATDVADATLAKARDELVALAQHPREQGSGVSVTRYWKAGNVDYKKVPMLKDVDLTLYRGKARGEVRVTAA